MDGQHYAEFLERIGHRVHQVEGVWWFNLYPRVYTCFPFEAQLDPEQLDLRDVLKTDGLISRYSCPIESGIESYRLVVSDKSYDLSNQKSKSRNQTRRGLERCDYGTLSFDHLFEHGIRLNRETHARQQRAIPKGFDEYWTKYYEAAADCPAATAWGSWHEGQLASYMISFRIGAVENICIVRSDRSLLKHYPNNAMLYSFLQHALGQDDISEVSIGFQSLLSGNEPLDHFKIGLGFQKQPIGQRIELRSTLGLSVPRSMASLAGRMLSPWGENEKLGRVSGLLNWYAQQPAVRRAA